MRPEPCLRVISKPGPGPVVPGSEALLTIEFAAPAEPGDFVGEVVIKTEVNVFNLTVSARVVVAGAGEDSSLRSTAGSRQQTKASAAAGSREASPEVVLDETKTLEEVLGQHEEQPPLA